jgi:hypothetical protein
MRIWAKIVIGFLALCELAVAALYVFGDPDNPHSLNTDPSVLRLAIMLPLLLVFIVGLPVALAILGWRLARRIFRQNSN